MGQGTLGCRGRLNEAVLTAAVYTCDGGRGVMRLSRNGLRCLPCRQTIPLAAKRLGGGEADVRAPPWLEQTHVVLQAALLVFVFGAYTVRPMNPMGMVHLSCFILGAARYPK